MSNGKTVAILRSDISLQKPSAYSEFPAYLPCVYYRSDEFATLIIKDWFEGITFYGKCAWRG